MTTHPHGYNVHISVIVWCDEWMCLTFKKKEREREILKNNNNNCFSTAITDCNWWTKGQTEPTRTASGVGLAEGLFCMLRKKKKRKTRIWWESLFTFMYQQISLRRRRNVTPVSNVWKAAPIRLFRAGPQRTQRITGNVFRISLQRYWQIDNGFFIRPIMARTQSLVHRWGNKTRISASFRRRALPGLFEGWLVLTRVSCKIFDMIFRASNHEIVHKEDNTEFAF